MNDVYKPHAYDELAALLPADVVARLDPAKEYGMRWWNRSNQTSRQVSEPDGGGRLRYRKLTTYAARDKEEWIGVPVPTYLPRPLVDQARAMIAARRPTERTSLAREWELRGMMRCPCGASMSTHTTNNGTKAYYYYRCNKAGYVRGPCRQKMVRASRVEEAIWAFVSGLLKDPDRLRAGLDAMIEEEESVHRGDPEAEQRVWLEKLAAVSEERRGYLRLAATGRITDAELDTAVAGLEEAREEAERELAALQGRRDAIANLERDRDALMVHYAELVPEALDELCAEERQRVYRILRIGVVVRGNSDLEVSGVFGEPASFSTDEFVPRYLA